MNECSFKNLNINFFAFDIFTKLARLDTNLIPKKNSNLPIKSKAIRSNRRKGIYDPLYGVYTLY